MPLVVEWTNAAGDVTLQLAPSSTSNGATRDLVDAGLPINFGKSVWVPFLDDKPSSGKLYRGGIFSERGDVTLPVFSKCADLAGILAEIDFLDKITSPWRGNGTLKVTLGTRVRRCPCYRTEFQAFYASPDDPTGAFGNLANGQLMTHLTLASASAFWYEGLTELADVDVDSGDEITVTNTSTAPWGVYLEGSPGSGVDQSLLIENLTTGRIWRMGARIDDTEVLRLDWYGTDEDELGVSLERSTGEVLDLMPNVGEMSDLELIPGDNVLRFTMERPWHLTISTRPLYTSI